MNHEEVRAYAVALLRPGAHFYLMVDELVFEEATVVAPNQTEIQAAIVRLAEQIQQAQAMRAQIYNGYSAALVGLLGRPLSEVTAVQLKGLWILEHYTGHAVPVDASGRLVDLPPVATAPLVYPVQLVPVVGSPWLVGLDNHAAWAEFVAGKKA